MKIKKKDKKEYFVGGVLGGMALAQGALGLGQSVFGMFQRADAKKELRKLSQNEPKAFVPTALRKLANEPVAKEYMDSLETGQQRRTSQAISSLGKGGSRTMAGALPSVMDAERRGELERVGMYEQQRKGALSQLAQAEQNVQNLNTQRWLSKVGVAQGELGAGQQNIFRGLESTAASLPYAYDAFGGNKKKTTTLRQYEDDTSNEDYYLNSNPKSEDIIINKDGGKVQTTEGAYSHEKNPLLLINKDGKLAKDKDTGKAIEVTGQETIIAPKDTKKIEALADKENGELSKFIKSLMKKFRNK